MFRKTTIGCLAYFVMAHAIYLISYFIFFNTSVDAVKCATLTDIYTTRSRKDTGPAIHEAQIYAAADSYLSRMHDIYGINPEYSIYKALKNNKSISSITVSDGKTISLANEKIHRVIISAVHEKIGKFEIDALAEDRSFFKMRSGKFMGISCIYNNGREITLTNNIINFLVPLYPSYK